MIGLEVQDYKQKLTCFRTFRKIVLAAKSFWSKMNYWLISKPALQVAVMKSRALL